MAAVGRRAGGDPAGGCGSWRRCWQVAPPPPRSRCAPHAAGADWRGGERHKGAGPRRAARAAPPPPVPAAPFRLGAWLPARLRLPTLIGLARTRGQGEGWGRLGPEVPALAGRAPPPPGRAVVSGCGVPVRGVGPRGGAQRGGALLPGTPACGAECGCVRAPATELMAKCDRVVRNLRALRAGRKRPQAARAAALCPGRRGPAVPARLPGLRASGLCSSLYRYLRVSAHVPT